MKKYHMMRLYQATKCKGYISHGERYKQMITFNHPGEEYKPEAAFTLLDTNMIIMVERISPYLVKEVKTGIVFPVVNFKKKNTVDGTAEYLYSCFKKVHTFVCSRENKLLSKEVDSSLWLEEYNNLHPNTNALREELLEILALGKKQLDDKLYEEEMIKQEVHKVKTQEKKSRKNEKLKVRRLKRQFKQERK